MKFVRELDAGKPHVQFDERRGGNGLVEDLGEQEERKPACVVGSDLPSSTAPPADSTRVAASATLRNSAYGPHAV